MKSFYTSEGVFEAGPQDVLGRGTYGTVFRVRNKQNPNVVRAIKIFMPETLDENEGIPSTTLREVNAVKSIDHPNIMSVSEVVIPSTGSLDDMFVVMELCKGTLRDKANELIMKYLKNDKKWINPEKTDSLPAMYLKECKIMAWQILNAIAVCHSRGIMHRDIKPANILWNEDDLLKIGDFGLARFIRGRSLCDEHIVPQTGEVQTMWYRAPEVLLGDDKYGMLIDDWSIGCVIAELFRFRMSVSNKRMEPDPLFAGRGDVHTFLLILEAVGNKADSYIKNLSFWSNNFPNWPKGNLRNKLKLLDDAGYDLISQLLKISPKERKASRYLLNHHWFDDVKSEIKNFVPWYRGIEKHFLKLFEIDRLPPAQPLAVKNEDQENQNKNSRN